MNLPYCYKSWSCCTSICIYNRTFISTCIFFGDIIYVKWSSGRKSILYWLNQCSSVFLPFSLPDQFHFKFRHVYYLSVDSIAMMNELHSIFTKHKMKEKRKKVLILTENSRFSIWLTRKYQKEMRYFRNFITNQWSEEAAVVPILPKVWLCVCKQSGRNQQKFVINQIKLK